VSIRNVALVNPPSSPFDFLVGRGGVAAATEPAAWLRALLDVEAALARAAAAVGHIPAAAADEVVAVCRAVDVDLASVFAASAGGGNPVIPLVAELARRVGDAASAALHIGATSQDVLDTATMLIARRSLPSLLGDLAAAADGCAVLAARHRDQPMVGRTLLQHAAPTSFGLVTAGWMATLDRASGGLAEVAAALPAQIGGSTGTRAAYGDHGPALAAEFAAELGLAASDLPWHGDRWPVVRLASALGAAAAAVGSIAVDVVLLAQDELGEVSEQAPGAGGSSAMPHKRNAIAAVSARAAAMQAPGLVANLLAAAGSQELQRAAGAWHAEGPSLLALLRATGSAAAWLAESIARLAIHADRMAGNLGQSGGLVMAGALNDALAGRVGRARARELVGAVVARARGRTTSFAAEARADDAIASTLSSDELAAVLDPRSGIDAAAAMVDEALRRRRAREGRL
jgi:3-carboxy-cis,cis-muconate cycloisomerase